MVLRVSVEGGDNICLPSPPQLDSTACKEMSVSDTEVSDVTWTDNGTFNLSEGHTPQTDNSEGVFTDHSVDTHPPVSYF